MAQSLIYADESERRVALAHEALAIAEREDDRILLSRIAVPVVNALAGPERGSLRAEIVQRAMLDAARCDDPMVEFDVHHVAYNVAVDLADPVGMARSLNRMREIAVQIDTPRCRWLLGILETFEATMAARLEEAEAFAIATFEWGQQISESDAFTIFVGQVFVIGTFAGRHADLFPLVEQGMNDNPAVLSVQLAYGVLCAVVGRPEAAAAILAEGMASRFASIPVDQMLTTNLVGYAIIAIDTADVAAAAVLSELLIPYTNEVSFTGLTSQGPIAAYVGKLASLLGHHEFAEEQLRAALETVDRFGWTYHRATTLYALAEARHRGRGALDAEGRAWLNEASELCHAGGFAFWLPKIEALASAQPDAARSPRVTRER